MEVFRAPHVNGMFVAKFDHMPLQLKLVGSSGGILFLAEFVVKAVGLLLGDKSKKEWDIINAHLFLLEIQSRSHNYFHKYDGIMVLFLLSFFYSFLGLCPFAGWFSK